MQVLFSIVCFGTGYRRTDMEKSTAERLLDVAEDEFAEHGFEAASMGVMADRVGIRQPGIYNYFKDKKQLYVAVMARLLDPWVDQVRILPDDSFAPEKGLPYSKALMRYLIQTPNVARLVQLAVLAGGWQLELLVNRWYRPAFEAAMRLSEWNREYWQYPPEMRNWVFMGHHSIMFGYVTLAPLHRELFGIDVLSEEAARMQDDFLQLVFRGLQKP
jgi:TetR/AcrR family transcriptional regulator